MRRSTTIFLIIVILIHCYLMKKYVKTGNEGEYLDNDSLEEVSGVIKKGHSVLYRTGVGYLSLVLDSNSNQNGLVYIYLTQGSIEPLSFLDFNNKPLNDGKTIGNISSGSGFYFLVSTNSIEPVKYYIKISLQYSDSYVLNTFFNCCFVLLSFTISILFVVFLNKKLNKPKIS
ncbi:hypothetical protein RB653_001658 [Dictyostelium firmibasis]|uniref:Uncharacterized protein n=1 Tax=Dictyostelium firmibasis TaxID=79012 RepID=A0AAN7U5F0_9MYCE